MSTYLLLAPSTSSKRGLQGLCAWCEEPQNHGAQLALVPGWTENNPAATIEVEVQRLGCIQEGALFAVLKWTVDERPKVSIILCASLFKGEVNISWYL